MLEMKIDNEEVVSKNNFTIKEEMQTASSTILNNTYPKSWEIDKDYISRFYYPKDYSKLDLENHIHINPEEGNIATIDGNATIQGVDTNKLQELINVEGNTTQDGTPTPDAPIPIEVVSGRQEVEARGNNNLESADQLYQKMYSVYTTDLEQLNVDGIDIIKFDNSKYRTDVSPYFNMYEHWKPNTQYTIRGKFKKSSSSGGAVYFVILYTDNTTKVAQINTTEWTDLRIVSDANKSILRVGFSYGARALWYLDKSSWFIGEGDITEYPVYKGNTYEINLGKNLLKPKYDTFNMSGVICTYTDKGLLLNGTPTANHSVYLFEDPLPPGDYIINGVEGGSNSSYQIVIYKNGTIVKYLTTTNYAFTVNDGDLYSFRFYIYLAHGNFDNVVLPYQIERGSVCTSYSPYFTPIELCKIGTYQDRIFKSSGKNLWGGFSNSISRTNGGISYVNNEDGTISMSGTATANSQSITATQATDNSWYVSLKAGTYTLTGGISTAKRLEARNIDNTSIGFDSGSGFTFTLTEETGVYVRAFISSGTAISGTEIIKPQIVEGTTVLPPEPYGSGKWYIEKRIASRTFNGSENGWGVANTGTANWYYYLTYTTLGQSGSSWLSNYYPMASIGNSDTRQGICVVGSYFRIRWGTEDTIANYKTWLNTHNVKIYWVQNVSTYTEITNEELISQLNSIELIDGLNNISISSPYLTGILQIHYNYVLEEDIYEPIFYGIVKNTSNISMNPRYPKYCSLQILDYKTLLSEGKCLDFVIYNKTISQAINMVVSSISGYGFELGNINILNPNEIIGTYSTNEKTAYDVLNYLADISGAKWSCRRKDKDTLYIDFYDPSLMPKGKTIEYTTEWACENNLVDLQFKYGTRDYRNKQIILSDEVSADITYNDMLISDGLNKEFTLPNKVAKLEKIEINNEIMSIATTEEKSVGIYADFYYSIGTDTITSNKTLPYGTMINISYVPIIQGREVVQNDNEINRIGTQLNIDGTISRYEIRNDENDSSKLLNIGETYLKYKGEAEITLTIKTHNNDLYNVGQSVYFDAPIQELKKDYLVKSKEINIVAPDGSPNDVFYTYTLSSSFNSEKEINWFDNQRNKLAGNIKDGEFISRNIDINNSANIIWDNLQISEITTLNGDNDLNAVLDAPLIH